MSLEKDPTTYSLLTYAWVIGLSSWGGVASFARKYRQGKIKANFAEFLGEIVIAGFTGVTTFYLCEQAGLNQLLSAAFVAIAGHMGTRAIYLSERLFEGTLRKIFGAKDES